MGSGHYFWVIFHFVSLCSGSLGNITKINNREMEKKILDQILDPRKYDDRIRPPGINDMANAPTVVNVNIFIRSIPKICDNKMEYNIELILHQQWTDERLKFDDIRGNITYLTLMKANVWQPDFSFTNEKEGHLHNIMMPNIYLRIFPNGSILSSTRISLTLDCPMNLKLYPLDQQICPIRIASYGWTKNDLIFLWRKDDAVQVDKNLDIPRFTLESFLTDYCYRKTITGEYSCLKVDLLFKREFVYYLKLVYFPCCMIVVVSWMSLLIDQDAVAGLLLLGVTTILTMITQTSARTASLSPTSYIRAIDVWNGCCLAFVFGAFLEFALVNYVSRSESTPYANITGREVIRRVLNDLRPELPKEARLEFYNLVTRCWLKVSQLRPSFSYARQEISRSVHKWIEDGSAESNYMDVSGFSEDLEHAIIYLNQRISEFECEIWP